MDTRFKFNLIRHLARKNKGFGMVMATGVGTAILIVGMSMMVRSQADSAKAYQQKVKAEALTAAEIGVTQVQAMLNENRALALLDADEWISLDNLDDPNRVEEIQKILQQVKKTQGENAGADQCGTSQESSSDVTEEQVTQIITSLKSKAKNYYSQDKLWLPAGKGEYRLVSYTFSETDSETGSGSATIVIEGRSGQDLAESNTRLQVKIGVSVEEETITGDSAINEDDYAPGLWLNDPNSTGVDGNSRIAADVMVNNCNIKFVGPSPGNPGHSAYVKLEDPNQYEGKYVNWDKLPLPRTKEEIQGILNNANANTNQFINISSGTSNEACTPNNNFSLPRIGHEPNSNGVYEYAVTSIGLSGNNSRTIQPGCKVRLHVLGDITMSGNAGLEHNCSNNSNCKFINFQIFGYGGTNNKVLLNGNGKIHAFIYAPDYYGGVNGGGNSGGFVGSLWMREWDASSTNHLVLKQEATWSDIPAELRPETSPEEIVKSIYLKGVESWSEISADSK